MKINEKKIAIVGVSSNTRKYGYRIFHDMLSKGFQVYGINPRIGEVAGAKLYKSMGELPAVPDLVITVVQPDVTERIVEECIELGVKEIWMQPGSESEQAVAKARDAGMNVVAHACFMVHQGIW